MAEESSSDSEWAVDDIPLPQSKRITASCASVNDEDWEPSEAGNENSHYGDEFWDKADVESSSFDDKKVESKQSTASDGGEPMIIVDMTNLSHEQLHSRFDKNSVNDSAAASELRKAVEGKYEEYAKNADLLAQGTIIPCGTTVWRMALVKLREDRPGHYFSPIFPPKKK
uniref:Uncharacterized protein n=1 Tax=Odontella aurita TaxID=265563 RepID=A0A7S4HN14_9STRA|mmetsp:Transcript_1255/g.3375  ORF Transcript_1255/g.3375 Transcript_1255/m.3375 type:complete len:170 (+) Transcript_1255:234-743(+)